MDKSCFCYGTGGTDLLREGGSRGRVSVAVKGLSATNGDGFGRQRDGVVSLVGDMIFCHCGLPYTFRGWLDKLRS